MGNVFPGTQLKIQRFLSIEGSKLFHFIHQCISGFLTRFLFCLSGFGASAEPLHFTAKVIGSAGLLGQLALKAKFTVAQLARKLVDRSEVEQRTVRQITAVKKAMYDMVRKLAGRLFNAPSEEAVEAELLAEVDHICRSFAAGMMTVPDTTPPEGIGDGEEASDGEG